MTSRASLLAAAVLLLLPGFAPPGSAEPVLDTAVPPAEVMGQIGEIVRKEFYKPRGLRDFNAAAGEYREMAESGRLDEASDAWLATLQASHTGRFTPDSIDYYELSEVFHRGLGDLKDLYPPEGLVTYPGIGMVTERRGTKVFAADVYDGGPAERAGVLPGDEILSVNGRPYAPIASFRDKMGQAARLQIRRAPDATPITLDVEVEALQPRETFLKAIRESVRVVEGNGSRIGYIRLWAFAFSGVEELVAELLTSPPLADVDGLVLDMRGRWGGAPADAADIFVGRAPHMTVTNRQGEKHVANMRWDKPVVGIIDEGTRSGMEILAYGLKSAGVPLVGSRTAGAVVAGRAFRLKDNSLLEVAVLDVHVDGERLEGAGVEPTIAVPFSLPYAAGRDPQRERAIEEMRAVLGAGG